MKKIFLSVLSMLILAAFTSCSQNIESSSGGAAAGEGLYNEIAGEAGDRKDFAGDAAAPEDPVIGEADGAYDMAEGGFAADGISDDIIEEGNWIPAAAGTLTAGEWVDNDHYTFWQGLYQNDGSNWETYRKRWNRTYSSRVFVTVTAGGKPLENDTVILTNSEGKTLWTAKTDNEGKAYLFCSASELSDGDLTVKSAFGGEAKVSSDNSGNLGKYTAAIETGADADRKKSLDLALIVDTTGSMSDELNYLQKELESVINRAAKENGNIPIRLSLIFYRDDGDEYVVRDFDFTDNISEAIKNLNEQMSDGGGDTPEKVNAALDTAVNKLSWEEDSTKLAFIILDAPPHSDDADAVKDMNALTESAAAKGIRLIPILASGGDKETEFLMRDFALKTGGSYLFLTDDSGVSAGQHIEPTVGDYTVEKLNDLMVKVINRYLKNFSAPAAYKDETVETKKTEAQPTEPVYENTSEVTAEIPSVSTALPAVVTGITDIPEITDKTPETKVFESEPPAASEGVTMTLIGGDLTDALDLEIVNNTENEYSYGLYFDLERFKDGRWTKVERTEDMIVIDIAVILGAHSSQTFNAPIKPYFGDLPDGEYRIALNLFSETGEKVTLYGDFGLDILSD